MPSLSLSKSTLLLWILGGSLFLLQLWSASTHGLSVDEAHYALYAYFPDWSYFDHPPLVGWLQLPALWLGGSDFALRGAPLACYFAAVFLVRSLTQRLFAGPDAVATANATTLIALTVPMFHLLSISIHPDGVLLPIACVVMLQVWQLRDPTQIDRLPPWLGLGVALGFAGLAKYTGVLLAVSATAVLLWEHGFRLFSRRGLWLAAAIAFLMISPVLLWNAQNQWISFRFQGAHAEGYAPWSLAETVRTQWEQVKTYGYLTTLTLLLGLCWRPRDPAVRFCLAFALPPAAIVGLLSGRGGSLTYWTAYAWIAALPIAGYGLARGWRTPWPRRGFALFVVLQLWFCLVSYGRIYTGGPAEQPGYHNNPEADLYGWDQASARARELALAHGLKSVSVINWTLASRAAWYARPFYVYSLDGRRDQISLWFGRLRPRQATVLIAWSRLPYALPLRTEQTPGFGRIQLLEEMPVSRLGRVISHFDFYLCEDWDGSTVSAPLPGVWLSAF